MRLFGLLRVLAFILLMAFKLTGTAFAEPCPEQWRAFTQFKSANTRAEMDTLGDDERYDIGTEAVYFHFGIMALNLGPPRAWANDPVALRKAAQVLIEAAPKAMPHIGAEYSYGACRMLARAAELEGRASSGSNRQSAPAARPAPSAKPAPAEKLPAARPAKVTAPWSPKAMSTDVGKNLNPLYAAERADALASCIVPMQAFVEFYSLPPALTTEQANLIFEADWLRDDYLTANANEHRNLIAKIDSRLTAGSSDPSDPPTWRVFRCLSQRRLAQLEGSPLIAGAVDGSLNPMTIGNRNSSWKSQGKDAKIIASDGKSAMDCVKLIKLTDKDSMMGMGGRVLSNQCEGPVEIAWCYTDTECAKDHGAQWTVGVGRSWPVSVEREIRWAACRGANTVSFVKGSAGLRFYCSAPAKK